MMFKEGAKYIQIMFKLKSSAGGNCVIVTFCGHRQVEDSEKIACQLAETLEMLAAEGADVFFLGGRGEFDRLAARAVHALKQRHPHIRAVLVLSYLNRPQHETERELYDETLYPPLESVPKRFAIARRNTWMAEQADVLVTYVRRGYGGAASMLQHAQRKGKRILPVQD